MEKEKKETTSFFKLDFQHKTNYFLIMKQIIFFILFFFILFLPVSILAVEVAPRISDREIIEKLAGLEAGQEALRSEINQRFEAVDQRFEALESQYERIWNLILVVLAGIMGLIGFIIWDRKTASQPLEKKNNRT